VGYSIKKVRIKSDFWVVFGLFWIFLGFNRIFFLYYMVKLYNFRKKIGFNPIYLDSTGTRGIFWVILVFFWVTFGIKSDFWYYTIDYFSSVFPLAKYKAFFPYL
jgi:hypothetical protein